MFTCRPDDISDLSTVSDLSDLSVCSKILDNLDHHLSL